MPASFSPNWQKKPIVIDLFAGPGGLGEGFTRCGFDIRVSIEKEKIECETLRRRRAYHYLFERDGKAVAHRLLKRPDAFEEVMERDKELARDVAGRIRQMELGETPFREVYRELKKAITPRNGAPLILLGGPPCQAYSIVGRSRQIGQKAVQNNPDVLCKFYTDKRHTLYREYLKILAAFSPDIFIMENVKGILSARSGEGQEKGSVMEQILRDICKPADALHTDRKFMMEIKKANIKLGNNDYLLSSLTGNGDESYRQEEETAGKSFLVKSEEFGIPQARHRIIICGISKRLVDKNGTPDCLVKNKKITTLENVLDSMPHLRSRITRPSIDDKEWDKAVTAEIYHLAGIRSAPLVGDAPFRAIIKKAKIKGNKDLSDFIEDANPYINDHVTRSHMLSDIVRYYFCADFADKEGRSPKIQDWPVNLSPAHADISNGGNRLHVSRFSDRFKVQLWDKPASTISSHISKDGHYYIHPDKGQCRSLSVREAARLQTFPDSYQFYGGISKQFHQVGNAVPPFLAYQIAEIIKNYLEKIDG